MGGGFAACQPSNAQGPSLGETGPCADGVFLEAAAGGRDSANRLVFAPVKKLVWPALAMAGLVALAGFGVHKLKARRAWLRESAVAQDAASAGSKVPRKLGPIEPALALYDGKLAEGWDDWGWGRHELGKGGAEVVFGGWGGILLHHNELPWQYGGLAFRYKAPAEWGEFMHVSLRGVGMPDDSFPLVVVEARHVISVDGWREVLIDERELNPSARPFDRVMIGSHVAVGTEPVLLDKIVLTKPSAEALAKGQAEQPLEVQCRGSSFPISELIYAGATDDWSVGVSARRIGGNPLSRANWESGSWNVGSDWFFENGGGQDNSLIEALKRDAKQGRRTAIVVPMLGWVAKDATSVGFPRAKFPSQRKFDDHKPQAGDGYAPDGKPLEPGAPTETSMPAPPELIQKWIRQVVAEGPLSPNQPRMYILDNEPSLWNVTHRDVHPHPASYDELLERTLKYAAAVREADPHGLIAGPAEWGWLNYMTSGVDRENKDQKDRKKHGDMPLVPWYLKQLAEHEKQTGQRLLDFLDLHFYPAGDGLYGAQGGTDLATSERRVRATRSLWDPSYVDESWIADRIRLIPRMREWTRDYYPGVKTSIGEWSFGADEHISGGLATAEALGRFGQQKLDAAFYWGALTEKMPIYWAFRAFRNFDGKGARFQDISLPVKESETVSLFASRDVERTRLVLVLINRNTTAKANVAIALAGCGRVGSSRLFSFDSDSKSLTPGVVQVTATGVSAALAPSSFAVVDLGLE